MKVIGIIKDNPITGVQYGLIPQRPVRQDSARSHIAHSVKAVKAQVSDFRRNRFVARHK